MAIDTPLFAANGILENEEFLDAHDQGHVHSDSDIDMVIETSGLWAGMSFLSHSQTSFMDLHKIIVWNCRGVASMDLFRNCKQFVDVNQPEILSIIETVAIQLGFKIPSVYLGMMDLRLLRI